MYKFRENFINCIIKSKYISFFKSQKKNNWIPKIRKISLKNRKKKKKKIKKRNLCIKAKNGIYLWRRRWKKFNPKRFSSKIKLVKMIKILKIKNKIIF